MKNIPLVIAIIIVIAGGFYFYETRPLAAPSAIPPTKTVATSTTPVASTPNPNMVTFVIVPAKSSAKFEINEVLQGSPFHVVGSTQTVSGQFEIDKTMTEMIHSGVVSINARTFKTDSSERDGAVGRFILKSEDSNNEFITFTPGIASDFPQNPVVGKVYTFKTTGDLKISGVTKQVTFAMTAKAVSQNEIVGTATATIKYPDFGLKIPNLSFVANVEDSVLLTFSFAADRK